LKLGADSNNKYDALLCNITYIAEIMTVTLILLW